MPPEILEEIVFPLSKVHQDKIEFHNKEFDKLSNEQKTLTRMMDNLYLDKLKGKISEGDYRFSCSFKEQGIDIAVRLEHLRSSK